MMTKIKLPKNNGHGKRSIKKTGEKLYIHLIYYPFLERSYYLKIEKVAFSKNYSTM